MKYNNVTNVVSALKKRIDTGERLERLLSNVDFQLFMDIIKKKQSQFNFILKNPISIGRIREYRKSDGTIELLKTTEEERQMILNDAHIRCHTIQQVIDLAYNFGNDAKIARAELEKITTKTQSSDATDVKK